MIKNNTYPNLPNKPFSSRYDDSSTNGMEHVEIPGLPGTYPNGQGRANRAHQAETYANLLQTPTGVPQETRIERVVDTMNLHHRIVNPEEARLAAHYEDTLRTAIPLGREALQHATEAHNEFVDMHGTLDDHLDEGNEYPTTADYRKAKQDYQAALGPDVAAHGDRLHADMENHDLALQNMVGSLDQRDRQAHTDYEAGVDNTAQVAAQDAEQFAQYLPPKE